MTIQLQKIIMEKYRFIGLNAYNEADSDIFFQRETEIQKVSASLKSENITIVTAPTGAGKTSFLKAGLIPNIKKINQTNTVIFVKIENYINNSKRSLFEHFAEQIKTLMPKNSYLDKIITPDISFWYIFKRIESIENKRFFLILDQFENIFTYPENELTKFKQELYELLYEQIPHRYRSAIDAQLSETPDLLTKDAFKKLYNLIDLHLLLSIKQDKISSLDFFADKIQTINKNVIEIPLFTPEQAEIILKKTSLYVPKYNIDDNFISDSFKISDNLITEIIKFLTRKNTDAIEAYQLQIIGLELEKLSVKNNIDLIDSAVVEEIPLLYKSYYEEIIEQISNPRQEISVRKFIEDELIFEYENRKLTVYAGLAKQKYELTDETIEFLISKQLIIIIKNEYNENFFELRHDALITPILLAKEKRIYQEIHIQEEIERNKKIQEEAKQQREKTKRNRKIAIGLFILLALTVAFAVFAVFQESKAKLNEKIANSTLFASYSFQNLDINPTLSLRLAEQAYQIAPHNTVSQKAVLSAFYKTNFFYENVGNIQNDFQKAFFSEDGQLLITISNKDFSLQTQKGETLFNLPKEKDILSVRITPDNKYIFSSTADSMLKVYDLKGKVVKTKNLLSLATNIAIAGDNSNILLGCTNSNIYLLNENLEQTAVFTAHSDQLLNCNFSDDQKFIVSSGLDNKIIVSEISGKIISEYTYLPELGYQGGVIEFTGFSPDNSLVFFVMNDYLHNNYNVKIWNWQKNEIISKFELHSNSINAVKFVNNNEIAIASGDNNIYIFNTKSNKYKLLSGHTEGVLDMKLDKKNDAICSISLDKTIKSWKFFRQKTAFDNYPYIDIFECANTSKIYAITTGSDIELASSIKNIFSKNVENRITNVSFSNDDNFLLVATADSNVLLLTKKGDIKLKINTLDDIFDIQINEKNKNIAIAGSKAVYFYNFDGKNIDTKNIDEKNIKKITFCGKKLVCLTSEKLIISNLDLTEKNAIEIENPLEIKTSQNGKIITLRCESDIKIYNSKLVLINKLDAPKNSCLAVAKSGNYTAWADNDGNCHLINKNGKEMYNFPNNDIILDIKFTSDDKILHIKTINMQGMMTVKTYFISIPDILSYVNKIKLFGNIYNPSLDELLRVSNIDKEVLEL